MKVLIPMLSKRENEDAFLQRATGGAKNVILLLVIDTAGMNRFGFTTSEISHGNELMDDIKGKMGKREVEAVLEWGETGKKIENLAKLQRVDKVVMVKQENLHFEKLVKHLKDSGIMVEVV